MSEISSYPSVYALGHKAIDSILNGEVLLQEKIDGSQISFSKSMGGELIIKSKRAIIYPENAGMFAKAVEELTARIGQMTPEVIYRGEYLSKPKHNVLAYDRVPDGNVVLFDIELPGQHFIGPGNMREEAKRVRLETVPVLGLGEFTAEQIIAFLETPSILGGQKVEGVVIKNYERFTKSKHIMIGKFVSEQFKEIHNHDWAKSNPSRVDVLEGLIGSLRSEARWNKAVQHLAEEGKLQRAPQDIGPLIKEVQKDVEREEGDNIRDKLWKHFWPQINRRLAAGLPEWYKERLALGELDV